MEENKEIVREENNNNLDNTKTTNNTAFDIIFGILSFILPPLGYVLYLVWKVKKPKASKVCGWCALASCLFYIVLAFILILVLKPGLK